MAPTLKRFTMSVAGSTSAKVIAGRSFLNSHIARKVVGVLRASSFIAFA